MRTQNTLLRQWIKPRDSRAASAAGFKADLTPRAGQSGAVWRRHRALPQIRPTVPAIGPYPVGRPAIAPHTPVADGSPGRDEGLAWIRAAGRKRHAD